MTLSNLEFLKEVYDPSFGTFVSIIGFWTLLIDVRSLKDRGLDAETAFYRWVGILYVLAGLPLSILFAMT